MEPENSLPHLHVPATCPYPEWDQTSPCPPPAPSELPEDPYSYYPPIYGRLLQLVLSVDYKHQIKSKYTHSFQIYIYHVVREAGNPSRRPVLWVSLYLYLNNSSKKKSQTT